MKQITFHEYSALHRQIKEAKSDMNSARFALQQVAEVLSSKNELIYDLKTQYEKTIHILEKQNKYLKRRISKYEEVRE